MLYYHIPKQFQNTNQAYAIHSLKMRRVQRHDHQQSANYESAITAGDRLFTINRNMDRVLGTIDYSSI